MAVDGCRFARSLRQTQVVVNPPDTPEPIIDESKYCCAPNMWFSAPDKVDERPERQANSRLSTGDIELRVTGFKLLTKPKPPYFSQDMLQTCERGTAARTS